MGINQQLRRAVHRSPHSDAEQAYRELLALSFKINTGEKDKNNNDIFFTKTSGHPVDRSYASGSHLAELTKAMTISSKDSNNQLIWTVDLGEGWGKLPYCRSSPIASRAWTAAYTYLSQKGLL